MIRTRLITFIGLLTAFGLTLELLAFPIMAVAPYLLYAPGDIPLLLVGYAFGPVWGVVSVGMKAVLYSLIRGQGGMWGTLMHFIASSAYVVVFCLIVRAKKTYPMMVVALIAATLARALVMIPANLVVTPIYANIPVSVVKGMLIPVIIPFNLIHGGVNALLFLGLFGYLQPIWNDWIKKIGVLTPIKRASYSYLISTSIIGFFFGGTIAFLLRPFSSTDPALRLKLMDILSRGAKLEENLIPLAQQSFNYLIIGMILGILLGLLAGQIIQRKRV